MLSFWPVIEVHGAKKLQIECERTNLELIMFKRTFVLFVFVLAMNACVVQADVTVSGSGTFGTTAITDANNEVFSTVSIAESRTITDISVTIEGLEHSNAGDLIAELRFLGPGGPANPAFLFFRPNVDGTGTLGSLSNLNGDYTFTSDPSDSDFWAESSIPDDETVSDSEDFFFSDPGGDFNDLSSSEFFGGLSTQGEWQLVITDGNSFGNNEGSVQGFTINFETIPEPSTGLVLLGLGAFFGARRRK